MPKHAYEDNIFERVKRSINIQTEVMNLLPGGRKKGNEWEALNPTRNDFKTGSFRVNLYTGKWADFATQDKGGDIISLYCHIKGVKPIDACHELLGEYRPYNSFYQSMGNRFANKKLWSEDGDDKLNYIKEMVYKTSPVKNTPVELYLRNRGITCDVTSDIRYEKNMFHTPSKMVYPAMVSKVRRYNHETNEYDLVGIHRTYLTHEGYKANIEPNKMMYGNIKGGGVFLSPIKEKYKLIVLAEGIETALSLYQALDKEDTMVIACLSSSNMQDIELPSPEKIEEVTIASDNDTAGATASVQLFRRLMVEGYDVSLSSPEYLNDFNDLLRK